MPPFRHSIPWERLCEFSKQEFRLWTEHILRGHREPKSLDSSKRADVCAKSQTISLEAPLRNYIGETRTDSRGTQSAAIIACAETWLEKNGKKNKKLSPASEMTRGIFFCCCQNLISSARTWRDGRSRAHLLWLGRVSGQSSLHGQLAVVSGHLRGQGAQLVWARHRFSHLEDKQRQSDAKQTHV